MICVYTVEPVRYLIKITTFLCTLKSCRLVCKVKKKLFEQMAKEAVAAHQSFRSPQKKPEVISFVSLAIHSFQNERCISNERCNILKPKGISNMESYSENRKKCSFNFHFCAGMHSKSYTTFTLTVM